MSKLERYYIGAILAVVAIVLVALLVWEWHVLGAWFQP